MSVTIKDAIEDMEARLCNFLGMGSKFHPKAVAILELTLEALREKADRENPAPLTVEELRQHEGLPVFLVIENVDVKNWAIIDFAGDERTRFQNGFRLSNEVYGKTWTAYRNKPKEASNGK